MKHAIDVSQENRLLGSGASTLFNRGLIVAVVGLVLALVGTMISSGGMHRLAWSYLMAVVFFISLGLGGMIWVLIQHTTRSGWSVAVRRLGESVMCTVPWLCVLLVPVVFLWGHDLYHWLDHEAVAHDPILRRKAGYLNFPFFVVRLVLYVLVWIFLSRTFSGRSRQQDQSGDVKLTLSLERLAPIGVILWALSATFFAFDLVMSLDPHWFSTIFGVYFFAGSFFAFNALLCVLAYRLQQSGRLTNAINLEHYHDIGKMMFAFTVFWSYIAFSQFMLIWYGNMPEETEWIRRRYYGGWGWVSVLLLLGHFVGPFLLLISRIPKRRPHLLVKIAVWNLFIHLVDIYWLVMPQLHPDDHGVPLHLLDLACLLLVGGIFVAVLAKQLGRGSLIAEKDPRLVESLSYENV